MCPAETQEAELCAEVVLPAAFQPQTQHSEFDILLDDLDTVPLSTLQRTNPRKQLQFLPLDDAEEKKYLEKATDTYASHSSSPELPPSGAKGTSGGTSGSAAGMGESGSAQCPATGARAHDFEYTAKIRTLAETERFFDELTKEKDQIEAALSRMPSMGGRVTLQTRLNQACGHRRSERSLCRKRLAIIAHFITDCFQYFKENTHLHF